MGYGVLELGMTRAEAIATGKAALTKPGKGSCGGDGDGYLVGSPNLSGKALEGQLSFSATTGLLVAIYAFPGMKTAQGVALGMTIEEVAAIHHGWSTRTGTPFHGIGYAHVAGNLDGMYRIAVENGKVVELSLERLNHDCAA